MTAALAVTFPVFAIVAIGFAAGRGSFLAPGDVGALNRFVFRFAMPAALFGLAARSAPLTLADARLAIVYAIAAAVVLGGAYSIGRRLLALGPAEAGVHALGSTLGNAVFLGLPIALAVPGWSQPFLILMLVEGIGVIAIGAMLIGRSPDKAPAGAFGPFRNPLVIGMTAGLGLACVSHLTGVALPDPVAAVFDLLGRAAGPTALFSLGVFLATTPLPPLRQVGRRVSAIAVMKMAVMPALVFAGLSAANIHDPAVKGAAMLFAIVPSGVGSFVMASERGVYVQVAAAAIALTTALSVVGISAVLVLFR